MGRGVWMHSPKYEEATRNALKHFHNTNVAESALVNAIIVLCHVASRSWLSGFMT